MTVTMTELLTCAVMLESLDSYVPYDVSTSTVHPVADYMTKPITGETLEDHHEYLRRHGAQDRKEKNFQTS
jgi:hypothetical protein